MKKTLTMIALGLFSSALGCAGMKLEKPDPKKMACESAAEKAKTETVKACNDKAGADAIAQKACDEVAKRAEEKAFKECMGESK